MNILPKKNWHVRTRKNIDKVRKDEAKAADEERKLNERITLAEREARTDFLRSRAKTGPSFPSQVEKSTHVDLFADSQLGRGDQRINLEHEKEEKLRTEKWEQQVGILTYLHKSQSDVDHPWYLQPHEERLHGSSKSVSDGVSSKEEENKNYHDPLNSMRQYLSKMKSSNQKTESEYKSTKRRDSKNHHKSKSTHLVNKEPEDKMTRLRRERLEREKSEKVRADKLLAKHGVSCASRAPSSVSSTPRTTDERKLKFHSQFNPHLARQ